MKVGFLATAVGLLAFLGFCILAMLPLVIDKGGVYILIPGILGAGCTHVAWEIAGHIGFGRKTTNGNLQASDIQGMNILLVAVVGYLIAAGGVYLFPLFSREPWSLLLIFGTSVACIGYGFSKRKKNTAAPEEGN